ncbi:MAG: hypothetical protein IKS55_03590 [Oscillospiraceae bacterium]|nr:hypothetical protein [Oscillospiraceae bacterium]
MLVAISIPIFTSQLEKSREATDLANLRSAYAECAAEVLTIDTATYDSVCKSVDIKQTTEDWVSAEATVADVDLKSGTTKITPKTGNTVLVTVYADGTTAPTFVVDGTAGSKAKSL